MKNEDKELYSTTDFPLAITLSIFFPLQELDRSNRRQIIFYFPESDDLQKTIQDYWTGGIRVEPQAFFSQMRIIKSRMYDGSS